MNTAQEGQAAKSAFFAKCFISLVCLLAIIIFRLTSRIEWEEVVLLGLAVLPWFSLFLESLKISKDGVDAKFLQQEVKKLKAKINDEIKPLAEEAKEIAVKADDRVSGVSKVASTAQTAALRGIGKRPVAATTENLATGRSSEVIAEDDLQKGKWGGQRIDEQNGRQIKVRIEKVKGEDFFRRVIIQVSSTDQSKKPLSGEVTFYLHQTFNPPVETVEVVKGVAEIALVAYGAFTVGAEADEGKTKLEYDIAEDGKNNDDPFYDR